jgi:peptide/nickel transport system ATP-binding protein
VQTSDSSHAGPFGNAGRAGSSPHGLDGLTASSAQPVAQTPLLRVENLCVTFNGARGILRAVDGVSYTVKAGEVVALVGESGCGKSVSSLAIMRLLPKASARITGRVLFEGRDLLELAERDMAAVRGRDIAMIFQQAMTSLNPVLSIGLQLSEPLSIHLGMTAAAARARACELLGLVGMSDPERRMDQYPHELSGGMRQRVMIAIALTCNPRLIIADEPTTALDVTIQAQILELLSDLSTRMGIAMVIITHNLGIVARYADRVNVMYAARQIEQATTRAAFGNPKHFYTLGLLGSIPRLDRPRAASLPTIDGLPPDLLAPPEGCRFAPRCEARIGACAVDPPLREVAPDHRSACCRADEVGLPLARTQTAAAEAPRHIAPENILELRRIGKAFDLSGGAGKPAIIRAVEDLSITIRNGETLGLVGESGCGKSTVSRIIVGLEIPTSGRVWIAGKEIPTQRKRDFAVSSGIVQMVFQDPFSSLNPRATIGQALAEPLRVHSIATSRNDARQQVVDLLGQVGLFPYMAERYPHELSGGQLQRVGIARALSLNARLIVCDEPVSALDVSVQAQVINLLKDLRERRGLSYLFISHDLAVVRHIADRIAVMYLGRLMEIAERDRLYENPQHPYTQALLNAVPIPNPDIEGSRRIVPLQGDLPSPLNPPSGCVFHTRCPNATALCRDVLPMPRDLGGGHLAACHYVGEGPGA